MGCIHATVSESNLWHVNSVVTFIKWAYLA